MGAGGWEDLEAETGYGSGVYYCNYGDEVAGLVGYESSDNPHAMPEMGQDVAEIAPWLRSQSNRAADLGRKLHDVEPPATAGLCHAGGSPLPGNTASAPAAQGPPVGQVSQTFCVGAAVRVKGLKSKPKLNGQEGVLLDCDASGRWTVCLKDGETPKLQEKFLELCVALDGLSSPTAPVDQRERVHASHSPPERPAGLQAREQALAQPAVGPANACQEQVGPLADRSVEIDSSQSLDITGDANTGRPAAKKQGARFEDHLRNLEAAAAKEATVRSVSDRGPPGAASVKAQGQGGRKEARLDDHLANLEAMMAKEQAASQSLLKRREEAAVVVPGIDQLLTSLDAEEERPLPKSAEPAASPAGVPRSFQPSAAAVPDLDQLLADIDSQEAQDEARAPSLEIVLANIDRDEEVDTSRNTFLMLGSGAEADPAKPADPLAKMLRLTGCINPEDVLPTRFGTPSAEERKSQVGFIKKKASWRQTGQPSRSPVIGKPAISETSLLGEGPLFDARGWMAKSPKAEPGAGAEPSPEPHSRSEARGSHS